MDAETIKAAVLDNQNTDTDKQISVQIAKNLIDVFGLEYVLKGFEDNEYWQGIIRYVN